MGIDQALSYGRETLTIVLLVAAPCLGISMTVGFIISIFQATTQIHDQTLAFVPKVVAVVASLMLFGGWMLKTLIAFTERLLAALPGLS